VNAFSDGEVRTLVFWPDKVLRGPCVTVTEFDESLRKLVSDMVVTLYTFGGAGLAANQIGDCRRVVVMDINNNLKGAKNDLRVFVNPVVTPVGEEQASMIEGCLSFPTIKETVVRPARVNIQATTHQEVPVNLDAGGWVARVIQHEVDHLDGKVFIDRLSRNNRRIVVKKMEKLHEGLMG